MKHLILASASPRRAELLHQIGVEFETVASNATETIPVSPTTPGQLVMGLALTKAKVVAANFTAGIVIGADTVVVLDNTILGKPDSPAQAVSMLSRLSGKKHRVFTGLALYEPATAKLETDYAVTEVVFRSLTQFEIEAYVESGEPLDKAGAYGIQGLGAVLVERIDGCYFNVVGLPLNKLEAMLKKFDVSIWEKRRG